MLRAYMHCYNHNLIISGSVMHLNHSCFPLLQAAQFVMHNRARLIQEVSTVMAVVDSLGTMVHPEMYAEIQAEKTRQHKMRLVFTALLDSGGTAVRAAFYDALKQHEPQQLSVNPGKITCTAK